MGFPGEDTEPVIIPVAIITDAENWPDVGTPVVIPLSSVVPLYAMMDVPLLVYVTSPAVLVGKVCESFVN